MRLTRRAALGGAVLTLSPPTRAAPVNFAEGWMPGLQMQGRSQQGGFLFGRTAFGAKLFIDEGIVGQASSRGLFVIGFDRDCPKAVDFRVEFSDAGRGPPTRRSLPIAPVAYDVQRIDGLPNDQVAPSDPALLARIKEQVARKTAAMASRDETDNFKDGFVWPLEVILRTSKFGLQRILNGVPKTPHYGVDLAAVTGTPIHAPAPGLVVFADPAMHFEGGLTLIDHGQGLISAYLHQSAQSVRAGQRVARGQEIGRVGSTGRATGPHLCWRLTWRGRHMDPSLLVGASAPA